MSVVAQVVKKFINDPDNVVPEALAGVAAAHPGLVRVDLENQLVLRADAPVQGKVGLVSGGGSGHEPMHGGFVGPGMLVCGFGLDAAHLPGDCPVTPLADVDAAFAAAGLEPVDRFSTWDRAAYDEAAGYVVTVHSRNAG